MNENLVTGVLCAVAGALASKAFAMLWSRRNGNGNGQAMRTLRAARELADITTSIEDLLRRMGDVEASIQRMYREGRGRHRGE